MMNVRLVCAVAAALTGIVTAQTPIGQSQPPAGWLGYGSDLAVAGDIDGDGVDDLFVPASILVAPGVAALGLRVISGVDLHVIWERTELPTPAIGSYRMAELDGGRDVNGDGVPDLLLSANGQFQEGRVDLLSGVDGSVIHHASPAQFGSKYSVAVFFVGDVDGDGTDDYVAGFSFLQFGKLTWFSGATGSVLQSVQAAFPALLNHQSPMDVLGDLNGDGVLEVCIGDAGFNGYHGRAWIHDGRTGALLFTVDGQQNMAKFGLSATDLGDLDGDGRPDFAISACSGIDPTVMGRVSAYSGATGAQIWTHAESQPYLAFGWALASVGDVDGDGLSELLVGGGTRTIHSLPLNVGHTWVLSGASGATLAKLDGSPVGDFFGSAVQGVDLDGDGRKEIVVAAPDYEQQVSLGGRIEVFSTCPLPAERTCAANTSQAGCHPTQSFHGSTLWSAPVKITLLGSDLPLQKPSLLLVSRGAAQLPFGPNTLCLAPPIRRILPQVTFGNPPAACSGATQRVLDQPLLTALGFGPGDGLTVQMWIADPPAPRGALSDALRIVLCP